MTKDFKEQDNYHTENVQPQENTTESYPDNNQNMQQDTPQTPPQKKSHTGILIFLIIIAFVVIVGFKEHIMSFFTGSHAKHEKEISKPVEPQPTHEQISSSKISSSEKQEIQQIIKEYIQQNPNVILESLRSMEQKMAQERSEKAQDFIKSNIGSITKDKPFIGNKNGTIVITKFFDYKCGYCKKAHAALETLIKNNPNLKVVLVELPIMGQQSLLATQASLAVYNIAPKQFAAFNNGLMSLSNIDNAAITKLANQNNINAATLMSAMKSSQVEQEISANMNVAREIGLQGVPAFIIGNEFIPGFIDYETLKTKIDKLQPSK